MHDPSFCHNIPCLEHHLLLSSKPLLEVTYKHELPEPAGLFSIPDPASSLAVVCRGQRNVGFAVRFDTDPSSYVEVALGKF